MTLIGILTIFAATLAVTFWIMLLRVDWSATLAGRSNFVQASVIAFVLVLTALRLNGIMLPEFLRAVAYAAIIGAEMTQIVIFRRVQKLGAIPPRRNGAGSVDSKAAV